MRDYPNMSYCMCQNTLAAMNQLLTAMAEEGPEFLQDMRRDELRAFKELFNACEDFIATSEHLEDMTNEAEEE
jgi:hypothetical protein